MNDVLAIQKWKSNAELIAACHHLDYLLDDWTILDPTYGHGTFWNAWRPRNLIACDLDVEKSPMRRSIDFTALPWFDESFDAVVFDPPYKLNGKPDDTGRDERSGVHERSTWQDRMRLIRAGAAECARVAETMLLVKVQDQVVSSKIRWQTKTVAEVIEPQGFGLRARFDFLSRRDQPSGRRQKNPHSCSSQLLVFQRGWKWSDQ